MKAKAYCKRVFIETFDGQVIAIESQEYPVEASDFSILELRDKQDWYWANDFRRIAKTNGNEIMCVRLMWEYRETFIDKVKKNMVRLIR